MVHIDGDDDAEDSDRDGEDVIHNSISVDINSRLSTLLVEAARYCLTSMTGHADWFCDAVSEFADT